MQVSRTTVCPAAEGGLYEVARGVSKALLQLFYIISPRNGTAENNPLIFVPYA